MISLLLTLVLGFASDLCDIIFILGYNYRYCIGADISVFYTCWYLSYKPSLILIKWDSSEDYTVCTLHHLIFSLQIQTYRTTHKSYFYPCEQKCSDVSLSNTFTAHYSSCLYHWSALSFVWAKVCLHFIMWYKTIHNDIGIK